MLNVDAFVRDLGDDLGTVRLECDALEHDALAPTALAPTASKKATSNVRLDGHDRKGFIGTLRL